jgi:surfactin synthase thioesterase subunit
VGLPGRDARLAEAPHTSMDGLVEDVVERVQPLLGRRLTLFGHSMGALVAFELARRLRETGAAAPERLVVSGCEAPSVRTSRGLHLLEGAELLERMGGGRDRTLLELMLPTLRADLTLVETYRYRSSAPLECPITAFAWSDDDMADAGSIAEWARETHGGFELERLRGRHLSLVEDPDELLVRLVPKLVSAEGL